MFLKASIGSAFALLSMSAFVDADVYMHNPRGSNDRNCERNVNRNNGNRLFDSQNNAKGGYACPRAVGVADNNQFPEPKKIGYYEGSYLPVEWTNQHGCGPNGKLHCEIVIQYACEDTLDPNMELRGGATVDGVLQYVGAPRDGVPTDDADAATDTIPLDAANAVADTAANRRYGVHESFDFYDKCSHRERNKGLFTADQNVRRNDATGTRQNPNGNRRGLECPEERDYYPYWAPSPWRDIAIMSSNAGGGEAPSETRKEWLSDACKYYMTNSQNVKPVGHCVFPADPTDAQQNAYNQRRYPNNEADCVDIEATWEVREPHGGGPPECLVSQFSRVNHLGNPANDLNVGQNAPMYREDVLSPEAKRAHEALPPTATASRYLWQIPNIPAGEGMELAFQNCALRLRYNVSTTDYDAYGSIDANGNLEATGTGVLLPDNTETPPGWEGAWEVYDIAPGLNASYNDDASPIQQDSYVQLGPSDFDFVSLAVNTNQYGRVFQDRSYAFSIKKRPADLDATTNIFNLNVRGKRGNIVQTYPAVEYDFVPNALSLNSGRVAGTTSDYIHWQWTGSDYNPRRGCNDAEGGPPDPNTEQGARENPRADRSNVVEVSNMGKNYPLGSPVSPDMQEAEMTAGEGVPLLMQDPAAAGLSSFFTRPCADQNTCTPAEGNKDGDLALIKKMALLGQEDILGANAENCLDQEELEAINNKNEREYHPRNCAKMNAAAHPYFDGGLQQVTAQGNKAYSFFSSRNNNFSNRDHTMAICVDKDTCEFTVADGAPENAFMPSQIQAAEPVPTNLLNGDNVATLTQDNDASGDGIRFGCSFEADTRLEDAEVAAIAVGCLLIGAAVSLIAVQVYRKYNPPSEEGASRPDSKHMSTGSKTATAMSALGGGGHSSTAWTKTKNNAESVI